MFKTEKIVKQQARAALHGNITQLIAAAGLVLAAFLAVQYIDYIVLFAFDLADIQTGKVSDLGIIVQVGVALLIWFGSPLLNGYLRTAANAAVHKDCGARDVFFYFHGAGRYFKTLLIDLLVYMLYAVTASALNISAYLQQFAPELASQEPAFTPGGFIVVFAAVLTVMIDIFIYMIFVHYPLMSYALNDEQGVGRVVFVNMGFAFKHMGKLLKLILSFAGWFALCFLVVPALYVLPYFSVAALTSARWLYAIDEKKRGAV